MKFVNILLALISVVITIASLLIGQSKGQHFDSINLNENVMKWIWLASILLLGIVLGHFYRLFSSLDDEETLSWEFIKESLTQVALWRSMITAPIIFGIIYLLARDQPDTVISSILAFENGFLSNVVLEKKIKNLSSE